MNNAELSEIFENELGLQMPPIGLAFVNEEPPDIPRLDTTVPSSCSLWRLAESSVFYASAEDHFNCALGSMVMGFSLPDEVMEQLQEDVGGMCDACYFRPEEVERVPKVASASKGIIYGPLSKFPTNPDAVLIWTNAKQSMIMGEAGGLINWASNSTGLLDRPGCGVIPVALALGNLAQSVGCIGMRTNTSIPDEYLLAVLPGSRLEELGNALVQISQVNQQMREGYQAKIDSL